jgi:hypothetical protein
MGKSDDGPRSLAVFLTKLEDGEFEQELSKKLHEMGLALDSRLEHSETATGSMIITLKFKADRKAVAIAGDVKSTLPKALRAAHVMWLNAESNFVAENPRQTKLGLREVEAPPAREVPIATEVRGV